MSGTPVPAQSGLRGGVSESPSAERRERDPGPGRQGTKGTASPGHLASLAPHSGTTWQQGQRPQAPGCPLGPGRGPQAGPGVRLRPLQRCWWNPELWNTHTLHTHAHTYTHARAHTYPAHACTCTHTYTLRHTHVHVCTCRHTQAHAYTWLLLALPTVWLEAQELYFHPALPCPAGPGTT